VACHFAPKKIFMDKETLVKRLKAKAYFRKKQLFNFYTELFYSDETAENLIAEIHSDLGEENLVSLSDIYYCWRHFKKSDHGKILKTKKEKTSETIKNSDSNFEDLTWTNPSDLDRIKLKSKFAK
jgi:hypothetical protein